MYWPKGAVTREVVEATLAKPTSWHIQWCEGGRLPVSDGFGRKLPEGVLENIPTQARRRQIERGKKLNKTYIYAFLSGTDEAPVLDLHEGPM